MKKYQKDPQSTCSKCPLLNAVCKVVGKTYAFLLVRWMASWWVTRYLKIFSSAKSFKDLDQPENLTPVWKFCRNWISFLFCLDNLVRLSFVIFLQSKVLLLHHPSYDFAIFCEIYRRVSYFTVIIWKESKKKFTWRIWSAAAFFRQLEITMYKKNEGKFHSFFRNS